MTRKLKVSTVRRPRVRKMKMRKTRVRRMNRRSMRSLYDDDDLGLGVADMPTTGGQGAGFQERARQNYSSHGVTNMARYGRHGRPVHRGRSSSHRRRYH
jgi:hypothetical protein